MRKQQNHNPNVDTIAKSSNSVVAGMDEDLNLSGNRYTIIVLVFFPFYILFNPVATVLARKLGPRPFLTGITLAFGLVVIGFGLVDDWEILMGLRMLLGIFESCFFPSALFLVSMWYLRREVAKRNAFFYLIGNSVGGFGGLLAFGLQQMAGVQGHEGWQWIFIWEGIITIIIAIIGFIFLVDFPEDAHKSKFFLKEDEIQIMIDRVDRDRGDAHVTEFNIWSYIAEGKDWKAWCFAINFGLSGTKRFDRTSAVIAANRRAGLVTYSISYFLPIILRDTLGFSVALAQCLTAPVSKLLFLYQALTDKEAVLLLQLSSRVYRVLDQRPLQQTRPYHRLQLHSGDHRYCGSGICQSAIRALLRRLLDHRREQFECTGVHDISSKQHRWTVEASIHVGVYGSHGRYVVFRPQFASLEANFHRCWRHHRWDCVSVARLARVYSRINHGTQISCNPT